MAYIKIGTKPYRVDLKGRRFGKLVVLEYIETRKYHKTYWKCICDCGKTHITSSQYLIHSSESISCGCLRYESQIRRFTKHGMHKTRIYRIWQKMLDRCEDINQHGYECYGGRGITVCERWHSFINFYNDVKEGYADNLTLDRYPDKDGNYEPNNFRWATMKEQSRNKRSNSHLEYNGEKLTYAGWAEKLGWNYRIISNRVGYGWPVEKILTEPVKSKYWRNTKKSTLCQQQVFQ